MYNMRSKNCSLLAGWLWWNDSFIPFPELKKERPLVIRDQDERVRRKQLTLNSLLLRFPIPQILRLKVAGLKKIYSKLIDSNVSCYGGRYYNLKE